MRKAVERRNIQNQKRKHKNKFLVTLSHLLYLHKNCDYGLVIFPNLTVDRQHLPSTTNHRNLLTCVGKAAVCMVPIAVAVPEFVGCCPPTMVPHPATNQTLLKYRCGVFRKKSTHSNQQFNKLIGENKSKMWKRNDKEKSDIARVGRMGPNSIETSKRLANADCPPPKPSYLGA